MRATTKPEEMAAVQMDDSMPVEWLAGGRYGFCPTLMDRVEANRRMGSSGTNVVGPRTAKVNRSSRQIASASPDVMLRR